MNFQNLPALGSIGQIHKKQLIKAAFTQKFRRQTGDIICGRHNKDRVLFFLHPGQELTKQPCSHIVAAALAADTGKGFFNFIDPEHTRADGLRKFECVPHILFGFTHILAQQPSHVQTHQRNLKQTCRRLGSQALTTARHTDDHNAFGHIHTELDGLVQLPEDKRLAVQPVFQIFQTTDVLNAFTEVNDLQHAGFLDELLLFLQDQSLISSCDTATVLIRQRQNLPDLELVQSLERKGNFVNCVSIHLNFHICDERTNNAPNLINGRQRDIKNRNVIFQLTRNDRHFRDNKNRSTVILVIEVVFCNAFQVRNYFGIIQFPVDILQNQEGLLLKTIIHGQLQKFFQRAALHRAFGLKVHKSKRIVELHTFCTLPNVRNCCIDHLEIKVVNVNDRVQRVNVGSQDIFCTAFHPYTSM